MSRTFKAVIKLGRKAGYSPLGRGQIGKDRMIYVSDPAWENLKVIAKSRGMSRSALIDSIGRGETVLGDTLPLTAPTISGNLIEDESIAPHLQPPPPPPTPTN